MPIKYNRFSQPCGIYCDGGYKLVRLFLAPLMIRHEGMSLDTGAVAGGFDEGLEQRMGSVGAGKEFWMELGAHHEGMIRQFGYFHQPAVRGKPGNAQPNLTEFLTVG